MNAISSLFHSTSPSTNDHNSQPPTRAQQPPLSRLARTYQSRPPSPPDTISTDSSLSTSPTRADHGEDGDETVVLGGEGGGEHSEHLPELPLGVGGRGAQEPHANAVSRRIPERDAQGRAGSRRTSSLSYNTSAPGPSHGAAGVASNTGVVGLGLARTASTATVTASGQAQKKKKWLVLVLPPSVLPHSPPPSQISGFANGYGASGRFSNGILMPLVSTYSAQISLIAREYSIPSVAGLVLHLCLPPPTSASNPLATEMERPRLTEEIWSVLWQGYWDGDEEAKSVAPGLPIAGRLEFDIDPRKARWLPAWISSTVTSTSPISTFNPSIQRSQLPLHARRHSAQFDRATRSGSTDSMAVTAAAGGGLRSLKTISTSGFTSWKNQGQGRGRPSSAQLEGRGSTSLSPLATFAVGLGESEEEEEIEHAPSSSSRRFLHHQSQKSITLPPTKTDMDLPESVNSIDDSPPEHESSATLSWPPTPPSPDRQPSPDLSQRMMSFTPSALLFPHNYDGDSTFTPTPTFSPKSIRTEPTSTSASTSRNGLRPLKLIERDYSISYKPLWACSDMTPTPRDSKTFEQEEEESKSNPIVERAVKSGEREGKKLGYPWSLGRIYEAVYPQIGEMIYPSMPGGKMDLPMKMGTRLEDAYPYLRIYEARYPFFDFYPTLPGQLEMGSTAPISDPPSIDVSHPRRYPSFHHLYPATYPNLNIYPSISTTTIIRASATSSLLYYEIGTVSAGTLLASSVSPHQLSTGSLEGRKTESGSSSSIRHLNLRKNEPDGGQYAGVETRSLKVVADELRVANSQRALPLQIALQSRYPFLKFYPSVYPTFEIYPAVAAISKITTTPPTIDLSLPNQYPFFQLYPPSYPHLEIYPRLPAQLVSVYFAHRPPSLDLRSSFSRSDSPLPPPSPDRLPSASLEDRLESATFPSAPYAKQFGDRSNFSGRDLFAREKELIGRDHSVRVRSLKDASELSPIMRDGTFGDLELTTDATNITFSSESSEYDEREDTTFEMTVDEDPFADHRESEYSSSDDDEEEGRFPLGEIDEEDDDSPSYRLSRKPSFSALFQPPPSTPGGFDFDTLPPLSPSQYDGIPTPSFSAMRPEFEDFFSTPSPTIHASEMNSSRGAATGVAVPFDEMEAVKSPTFEVMKDYEDKSGSDEIRAKKKSSLMLSLNASTLATSSPPPVLFSFPPLTESDDLALALGQFIVEAQSQSIERRGRFCIGLSGGSLVSILTEALVDDDRIIWDKWEVFLVDERLVPLSDPQSNFGSYSNTLFSKVPIPAWQIHSIKSLPDLGAGESGRVDEKVAEELAEDYETQLVASFPNVRGPGLVPGPPQFDLMLLGMGPDGHIASLFPAHPLLSEKDWWVAYLTDSPKPPSARITFTLPLLCASRRLAFVCTGEEKREAMREALDSPGGGGGGGPAGKVQLKGHPVVWFADEKAAGEVQYSRSQFWDLEED